jgi:hypothetical protein
VPLFDATANWVNAALLRIANVCAAISVEGTREHVSDFTTTAFKGCIMEQIGKFPNEHPRPE